MPQFNGYGKISFTLQNGNLVKMQRRSPDPTNPSIMIMMDETTYVYDTAHKNPYINITGLDKILYGLPGGLGNRATNFATKMTFISYDPTMANGAGQQAPASTITSTLNATQFSSFMAPAAGTSEMRTVYSVPNMPPMTVNGTFNYIYQ